MTSYFKHALEELQEQIDHDAQVVADDVQNGIADDAIAQADQEAQTQLANEIDQDTNDLEEVQATMTELDQVGGFVQARLTDGGMTASEAEITIKTSVKLSVGNTLKIIFFNGR